MNGPNGLRLTILGMQGAGKGTVGRDLADMLAVPFVSVGDLLRSRAKVGDELASRIRLRSERGEFVDDEIINPLIAERLARQDVERGFVLDGYPRKQGQDTSLDRMLASLPAPARLDYAIYLLLTADIASERLSRRLLCDRCGLPASSTEASEGSPCTSGCGGVMQKRDDDLAEHIIERRHAIFEEITLPLVERYADRGLLITVDASQSRAAIAEEITVQLGVGRKRA